MLFNKEVYQKPQISVFVNSTSKCKFTELVRKSSPVVF